MTLLNLTGMSSALFEQLKSAFHEHLDECEQCRNNPFGLCETGNLIFLGAMTLPPPNPPAGGGDVNERAGQITKDQSNGTDSN